MTIRFRVVQAGAAFAALCLGGCLARHDDSIAMSGTTVPSIVDDAKPKPIVTTVRQADTSVPEATDPFGHPEQIPTAAQIFDFHPPGSKANQWRQPFVIEDHGGPLDIYRRQTAAMLKQLQDPSFEQTLPGALSTPAQGARQSH